MSQTPIDLSRYIITKPPKPATCNGCIGLTWGRDGFMAHAEGTANNGVMLVGEALGEEEEKVGKPFQGKAGHKLTGMLARRGLRRDQFAIDNTIRCRPPKNKLEGQPYESAVVGHCAPNLDGSIARIRPRVIVPLGAVALQRVLGLGKGDKITPHRGYVSWSFRYNCWVIPTYHPSYIMRGQQRLENVFVGDIEAAVEIAAKGGRFSHADPRLLVDIPPEDFERWVDGVLARPDLKIAYDIETPYKATEEDESDLDVEDPSFIILRVGFSTEAGSAVSIPWSPEYLGAVRKLLGGRNTKLGWNLQYDYPRLVANGCPVEGVQWDLMWGWHVLNSDLPKGLAFVAPALLRDVPRWKHLGKTDPGPYNALDANVTWRLHEPIERELHRQQLWKPFERHVIKLDWVLNEMSKAGMPLDNTARIALSKEVRTALDNVERRIQTSVPIEVRRKHVYKKPVKDKSEGEWTTVRATRTAKQCTGCGLLDAKKAHTTPKSIRPVTGTKRIPNPCHAASIVEVEVPCDLDALVEPFVVSNLQLTAYANHFNHKVSTNKEGNPTFDEDAINKLTERYPRDPLYPSIVEFRGLDKLRSTYVGEWVVDGAGSGRWIGGMPLGADGRVHTTFGHKPSTLRLSSRAPNLQNIPRGNLDAQSTLSDRLFAGVKKLFVAEEGCEVVELDYSAIEAVLVGYLALAVRGNEADALAYIRLARLGVHDYFNSHVLSRQGKIERPADIKWSDADLKVFFKDLKKRFPIERDGAKRTVHLSNYAGTPARMRQAHPELFPSVRAAAELQDLYLSVCPAVRKWQENTVYRAKEEGYLRNPFGYVHRFHSVIDWKLVDGKWEDSWGDDAKRALAFLPQSTAAGIIKEAMLRLWYDTDLGRYLRLQVHDSLVLSVPKGLVEEITERVRQEMEKPVTALPLEPAWGLGSHLVIYTESKHGPNWGSCA